jgi:hypothetical protein
MNIKIRFSGAVAELRDVLSRFDGAGARVDASLAFEFDGRASSDAERLFLRHGRKIEPEFFPALREKMADKNGGKIQAIKFLRERTQLGLKEAKDFVESLEVM